jgi:hypothetical protein
MLVSNELTAHTLTPFILSNTRRPGPGPKILNKSGSGPKILDPTGSIHDHKIRNFRENWLSVKMENLENGKSDLAHSNGNRQIIFWAIG